MPKVATVVFTGIVFGILASITCQSDKSAESGTSPSPQGRTESDFVNEPGDEEQNSDTPTRGEPQKTFKAGSKKIQ